MERKLIFLDIDGTMLSSLGRPSLRVREAIRGARARGNLVFLCTGRNTAIIGPDILEPGFDGVVASAGAYVEVGGRVLYDSLMSEALVQECLTAFHDQGIYCRLETREGVYTDPQMEELVRTAAPDLRNSELLRMQRSLEEGLAMRPYADYPRQGAYKICFTSTTLAAVAEARKRLEDRFTFVVHPFGTETVCFNGEIIRRGVDKGEGIRRVCRELGAPLADTIAFGDSMNDAAMLETAGVGVAMGNACEELKALADTVCEDVAGDGVFWELRRRGMC